MRHWHTLCGIALTLACVSLFPASGVASDVREQYESCWIKAAVGKLDATPYKTEKQAEKAVMQSADHADRKCVKLARRLWKTQGELAWTEQHNYMMVQFANANLRNYGQ